MPFRVSYGHCDAEGSGHVVRESLAEVVGENEDAEDDGRAWGGLKCSDNESEGDPEPVADRVKIRMTVAHEVF